MPSLYTGNAFLGNVWQNTDASAAGNKAKIFGAGLQPAAYFTAKLREKIQTPSEEYIYASLFEQVPFQKKSGSKKINWRRWKSFNRVDTNFLDMEELIEPTLKALEKTHQEMEWEVFANGLALTDIADIISNDDLKLEMGMAIVYNSIITRDYMHRKTLCDNNSVPSGGIFVSGDGSFKATVPSKVEIAKLKLSQNINKLVAEMAAKRVPKFPGGFYKLIMPKRALNHLIEFDSVTIQTAINTGKTKESIFKEICLRFYSLKVVLVDDRIAVTCPKVSGGAAPTKANFAYAEVPSEGEADSAKVNTHADNVFDVAFLIGAKNLYSGEVIDEPTKMGSIIIKDFDSAPTGFLNRYAIFAYKGALGTKIFRANEVYAFLIPNYKFVAV